MKRLLRTVELARVLQLQPPAVWRMVRRGTLPVIRVGGQYRFEFDDVLAALRAQGKRRSERIAEGGPGSDGRGLSLNEPIREEDEEQQRRQDPGDRTREQEF